MKNLNEAKLLEKSMKENLEIAKELLDKYDEEFSYNFDLFSIHMWVIKNIIN